MTITLTSGVSTRGPKEVVQRTSTTGATSIDLGGTATAGTPHIIEVRVVNDGTTPPVGGVDEILTWSEIARPQGGQSWSGSLYVEVATGGWYNFEVRSKDAKGVVIETLDSAVKWGVGPVIGILGQSNVENWNRSATPPAADAKIGYYNYIAGGSNAWLDLVATPGGNGIHEFLNKLQAGLTADSTPYGDIPVGAINTGKGGTSLIPRTTQYSTFGEWLDELDTNAFAGAVNALQDATGKNAIEAIVWQQGLTEASPHFNWDTGVGLGTEIKRNEYFEALQQLRRLLEKHFLTPFRRRIPLIVGGPPRYFPLLSVFARNNSPFSGWSAVTNDALLFAHEGMGRTIPIAVTKSYGMSQTNPMSVTLSSPHGQSGTFRVKLSGVKHTSGAYASVNGWHPAIATGDTTFTIPVDGTVKAFIEGEAFIDDGVGCIAMTDHEMVTTLGIDYGVHLINGTAATEGYRAMGARFGEATLATLGVASTTPYAKRGPRIIKATIGDETVAADNFSRTKVTLTVQHELQQDLTLGQDNSIQCFEVFDQAGPLFVSGVAKGAAASVPGGEQKIVLTVARDTSQTSSATPDEYKVDMPDSIVGNHVYVKYCHWSTIPQGSSPLNFQIIEAAGQGLPLLSTFGPQTRPIGSPLWNTPALSAAQIRAKITAVVSLPTITVEAPGTIASPTWIFTEGVRRLPAPGDRYVCEKLSGEYIGEGTINKVSSYVDTATTVNLLLSHAMTGQAPAINDFIVIKPQPYTAGAILGTAPRPSSYGLDGRDWSITTDLALAAIGSTSVVLADVRGVLERPVLTSIFLDVGTADDVEIGFEDADGLYVRVRRITASTLALDGIEYVGPVGGRVVAKASDAAAAASATVIANGTFRR